jgi:hypothetical protein
MIRLLLTLVLLPTLCLAQTTRSSNPEAVPDIRTFDLTPTPPPVPALKYELLYDTLADRTTGNAAILYMQTTMLLGATGADDALKALDAYEANDLETFDKFATAIDKPAVMKNLDLAARRDSCDWQPPIREFGAEAMLPHLQPIAHGLTRTIKARALYLMEHGQPEEAIKTLRLGYEMSEKVGREPTLISGLVALAIRTQMNDAIAKLMTRPNAPNLYWALMQLPSGRGLYFNSVHVERRFLVPSVPNATRALKGEELTPDEWRKLLDYVAALTAENGAAKVDPVKVATAQNLKDARELYAKQRGLSADQVVKLDPIVVLGNLYIRQADVGSDDLFKLRNLPYPIQAERAAAVKQQQAKLKADTPGNPFLPMFDLGKVISRLARSDRQHAALVNVEAIRSYAAANGGKLPSRLEDIAETPAMQNAWTGKAFDYAVTDATATLSDASGESPIKYTIRIRR